MNSIQEAKNIIANPGTAETSHKCQNMHEYERTYVVYNGYLLQDETNTQNVAIDENVGLDEPEPGHFFYSRDKNMANRIQNVI